MVAFVTCIPCGFGKCEECEKGHTRKGVMGGWICSCKHDEEAQRRARYKIESTLPFEGDGEFGRWEEVTDKPSEHPRFGTPIKYPGKQMRWVPYE